MRLAFLMFIEPVILLDVAIAQLSSEHFAGQPMLFRDTAVKLAELLKMATDLSTWFNVLAGDFDAADIDLDELRNSLQSEADHQVSVWVSRARMQMLRLFGTIEEIHEAMDQASLLLGLKSEEGNEGGPGRRNGTSCSEKIHDST
jgi:hypothetical protein